TRRVGRPAGTPAAAGAAAGVSAPARVRRLRPTFGPRSSGVAMRSTSTVRVGALACGAAACLGWALYRRAQRPRPADTSGWSLPRMTAFLARRVPGLRVVPLPYPGAGNPGAYLTRTALPPERLCILARQPERGRAWAGTVFCEEVRMSGLLFDTWG